MPSPLIRPLSPLQTHTAPSLPLQYSMTEEEVGKEGEQPLLHRVRVHPLHGVTAAPAATTWPTASAVKRVSQSESAAIGVAPRQQQHTDIERSVEMQLLYNDYRSISSLSPSWDGSRAVSTARPPLTAALKGNNAGGGLQTHASFGSGGNPERAYEKMRDRPLFRQRGSFTHTTSVDKGKSESLKVGRCYRAMRRGSSQPQTPSPRCLEDSTAYYGTAVSERTGKMYNISVSAEAVEPSSPWLRDSSGEAERRRSAPSGIGVSRSNDVVPTRFLSPPCTAAMIEGTAHGISATVPVPATRATTSHRDGGRPLSVDHSSGGRSTVVRDCQALLEEIQQFNPLLRRCLAPPRPPPGEKPRFCHWITPQAADGAAASPPPLRQHDQPPMPCVSCVPRISSHVETLHTALLSPAATTTAAATMEPPRLRGTTPAARQLYHWSPTRVDEDLSFLVGKFQQSPSRFNANVVRQLRQLEATGHRLYGLAAATHERAR